MKQTNNAIKFLMAQYRAIFKSAYVKGLATAVVLTSALAAGQTQAASITTAELAGTDPVEITDTGTTFNAAITADSQWNAAISVTGTSTVTTNTLTNTGAKAATTLKGKGTLTINADSATSGAGFTNGTTGTFAGFNIDIAKINVVKGTLAIKAASDTTNGFINVSAKDIVLGSAGGSGENAIVTLNGTGITGVATLGGEDTTITLNPDAKITFAAGAGSGATAVLSGLLKGNGGTLDFSSGDGQLGTWGTDVDANVKVAADKIANVALEGDDPTTVDVDEGLLQFTKGTIAIASKGSKSGGQILVNQGTLAIEKDTVLTVSGGTAAAAGDVGSILVSGAGVGKTSTLRIDTDILASFLKADKPDSDKNQDVAGAILVQSNGTLELNSDKQIVLNEFITDSGITIDSGDAVKSGSISISGGAIKADKLAVTESLAGMDLSKTTLSAKELTIGSDTYDSTTNPITFAGSKVSDKVTFLASGDTFTLDAGTQELASDYYVRSGGENTSTLNSNVGIITGDHLILKDGSKNATLQVSSGIWETTGQNITAGQSGALTVTSIPATKGDGTDADPRINNGNPSLLTIKGGTLTIGDADGEGSVNVTGTKGANATLDLTQVKNVVFTSGSITVSGDSIDSTNFADADKINEFYSDAFKDGIGYGVLKLNSKTFTDYLANSTVDFTIDDGGIVQVGNLSTSQFDVEKFISGAATAGKVSLSGAGFLVVDGGINLYDGNKTDGKTDEGTSADVKGVDIGDGTIIAKDLRLTNYARKTDAAGNKTVETSKILTGTIELSQGFSTNSSTLEIGSTSTPAKNAALVLDAGLQNAGTLSFGGTTHEVKLLGDTNSGGSLTVNAGTWSAESLDLSASGKATGLNIGSTDEELIAQAKLLSTEEAPVYVASFTADNFKADTGAGKAGGSDAIINIGEQSIATFNTMQFADNNVTVDGKLVINGKEVAAPADGATADVAFVNPDTDGKFSTTAGIALGTATIDVNGTNANLEFGTLATSALIDLDGNTTEGAKSTYKLTSGGIDQATFNVTRYGSLTFNFDKPITMSADDVSYLVDELLDDSDKTAYLVLNNADWNLTAVERDDNKLEYTWDSVRPFVQAVGSQATTDKLKSALISGIDSSEQEFRGHYGAALVDTDNSSFSKLTIAGPTGLHNAADFGNKFVQDKNGNVMGVSFNDSDASLVLENGGQIGEIVGSDAYADDQNSLFFTGLGKTEVLGNISRINELNVENETTVQGDVSVESLNLNSSLTVAGDKAGKITASDVLVDAAGSLTAVSLTLKDADTANVGGIANILGQVKLSDTLSLEQKHEMVVWGGAVSTKDVTLTSTSAIDVGYEPGSNAVDDPTTKEVDESKSYTGTFEATGTTTLNGGVLAVDPAYTMPTSLASLNNLSTGANEKTVSAGKLDGQLYVGQNAALAVGSENLAQLQDKIARFQTNGSLGGGEDEIGSILYVAKNFTVDPTLAGITLTAQSYEDFRKYFNENNGTTTDLGVDETALINTMYLGNNTAILVDAAVMSKAAGNNATAVVTFDSTNKGTVIADGGEVIIDGDLRATTYQVFANADIKYLNGDKYAVVEDSTAANYENNINVTTTNEFLQGVVAADGSVKLGIASDGRAIMGGASDPVYETLVAYVNGYNGTPSKNENGVETVAESQKLYNGYIDGPAGEDGKPTKVKNTDYSNSFLQAVISNGNGQDAETAARLGVFGGSVQAAISAGNTSADAIAGRFGMGAQAAGMTFADNGQGAGLWVAPVYRTADSDSFDAEGVEYGVDMNLYGVALGGDYTLSNGLRIGAMFNIGSGDADGQGAGSLATNDFDYYGFAAFAGYTMGQFSVVGDISYTTVDNEVTANTSVDKIGAKFDSTNLSVGVTGQYALNFNGVDVTPHAGMRLSMIDMDDYTVDGENEIANYSADKMTVFSIPVGVTFAKEFEGESWTVKPSFDLTLTGQFGDDKAEGTVEWKGVSNLSTAVSSEVFDNFTYGAAAGVAAKTGNFSLGLGLNYTGSSNVSEFGVNANARFVF